MVPVVASKFPMGQSVLQILNLRTDTGGVALHPPTVGRVAILNLGRVQAVLRP